MLSSVLDWCCPRKCRRCPAVCHSMQHWSEDGQMSGRAEPTKEPDPLSSESLQDTLAVSEKKVVTLEDFKYVDFADAEFSDGELEEFKKFWLSVELPPQTVSDAGLRSVGFKGPNPWATCWLERCIMNS